MAASPSVQGVSLSGVCAIHDARRLAYVAKGPTPVGIDEPGSASRGATAQRVVRARPRHKKAWRTTRGGRVTSRQPPMRSTRSVASTTDVNPTSPSRRVAESACHKDEFSALRGSVTATGRQCAPFHRALNVVLSARVARPAGRGMIKCDRSAHEDRERDGPRRRPRYPRSTDCHTIRSHVLFGGTSARCAVTTIASRSARSRNPADTAASADSFTAAT